MTTTVDRLAELLEAYSAAVFQNGKVRGADDVSAYHELEDADEAAPRAAIDAEIARLCSEAETGTKLVAHVRKFIADNSITCPETIYQTDRVVEHSYAFIEGCAKIVGYAAVDDEDGAA